MQYWSVFIYMLSSGEEKKSTWVALDFDLLYPKRGILLLKLRFFDFFFIVFFLNVCLFVVFLEALMKEQEQYMSLLQQLKDYDERLTEELAAKAFQEQEKQKLEVMPLSCFEIIRFPHCLTNYEMLIRDNSRGGSLSVTE